jgi:multiple sugar transport system permease protein
MGRMSKSAVLESPKAANKPAKTPTIKQHTLWYQIKESRPYYLMMTPFLIVFFIFTVLPVVISIYYSFTYYNMLEAPRWIGWLNYQTLFVEDKIFLITVRNTLVFGLVTGPLSYMMCFVFAWMINDLNPKVRTILTVILYAPSISGGAYTIWQFIFASDSYGLVNSFLMRLGFLNEPVRWFQDADYALTVIMIIQIWLSLGTGFLTFIAGFQSLNQELFEAGAIDGVKNRFQQLWYITVPQMYGQLVLSAVLQISSAFSVSTIVTALAGFPTQNYCADTIVTHITDYGTIRYEMGYASAISVILFIAMVLFNNVVQKILGGLAHAD